MPMTLLDGFTSIRGLRDQIHICSSCDEASDNLADDGMIIDRIRIGLKSLLTTCSARFSGKTSQQTTNGVELRRKRGPPE
jgi:hypothetical protein